MTHFKNLTLGLFAACFSGTLLPAYAHDFWLAPESYQAVAGEAVEVSIKIGHPKDRLNWPAEPHRIVSFRAFSADGVSDHQAAITDGASSKSIPMTFSKTGTQLLTIETTQAFSELGSEKFNAYLEEEGLTPIKVDRVLRRTTDTAGTELYSRRGKSIIQVGELEETDPDFLTRPVGMTLEVVPLKNPARISEGGEMKSQIFYRGKPQAGVTVGLVDLEGARGVTQKFVSDENGYVSFARPETGAWMQHAVWSAPLKASERADYTTIFSSLSFYVP